MDQAESAERVREFGDFEGPFRNIRLIVDGTSAILDLVPRKILERTRPGDLKGLTKKIRNALKDTKPIVEADTFLRIEFAAVQGLVVQEEFIDKITLVGDRDELRDGTFAKIVNSAWRATLEEYEMGDNPHLDHYRAWSDETRVDVLGVLVGGKWVAHDP